MKRINLGVAVLALALVASTVGAATNPTTFADPVTIATPTQNTVWMSMADIDGDGDRDLMATNVLDGGSTTVVAWYRNDGQNSYVENIVDESGKGVQSGSLVDLDGDGDIDLVAALHDSSAVGWYENDGAGKFTKTSIDEGYARGSFAVAATDIDGDGDIDIAYSNDSRKPIGWYKNLGDQTFEKKTVDADAGGARSIVAADLDGDGDIDLAAAITGDDTFAWYENVGNETFSKAVIDDEAKKARFLTAFDIDRDGDLDLATASGAGHTIAWYENNRDKTFAKNVVVTDAYYATNVAPADIDGDGDIDLASFTMSRPTSDDDGKPIEYEDPNDLKSTISWYRNDGNEEFTEVLLASADDDADFVVTADRDHDGDLDLVTVKYSRASKLATIEWFENTTPHRPASFAESVDITTDVKGTQSMIPLDLDRDGDQDLIVVSDDDNTVAWLKNNGAGGFTKSDIDTTMPNLRSVAAGDFDRDGDIDLATGINAPDVGRSGRAVYLFTNDGQQNFTKTQIDEKVDDVRAMATADLDRDGHLDLLVAGDSDRLGTWAIIWLKNDGKGNFAYADTLAGKFDYPMDLLVQDLDGDGDLDLALASSEDDTISWFENDGSQKFTEMEIDTDAGAPIALTTADFNRDGKPDLAAASYDNSVVWYRNDGEGKFTKTEVDTDAKHPQALTTADFNRDGKPDLVASDTSGHAVAWYQNDGEGKFAKTKIDTDAGEPFSVVAADFDKDGDVDIAYVSWVDDIIRYVESTLNIPEPEPDPDPDPDDDDDERPLDPHGFVDVPTTGWKDDAVRWMKASKVTTGCGPTTFCPDEAMTREQQVTFLWRYNGQPDPGAANPFTDVARDRYFAQPIDWAYKEGITTGYAGQNRFGTGDPVTRAQAVTMLWRQYGKPAPAGDGSFADVASDRYFTDAVAWAYEVGVTKGTSKTTFSPDDPVTRVQFAAFLSRYDQLPQK